MLGQEGRTDAGRVAAVSASLALVLLSGVAVAVLQGDTASADTVLARGDGAVLELADGSERPAVTGQTVPRGATVRAGLAGARLDTRDREVHLGGSSAVTVVDGDSQELREGFVLVDASDAPGLELRAGGALVTADDDSLVRVDGGSLARVGVLRGPAAEVRPAGRSAATAVPTYFSVQIPSGGTPGRVTPFALTPGDAYERLLAAELVMADADLTALASRLGAESAAGRAVLAALGRVVPAEPAPVLAVASTVASVGAASERALGYLIATAADGSDPLPERYAEVRGLRSDGGSWGVVAAIVRAPVAGVGAALDGLLDPQTVPVVAAQPLDVGDLLGGPVEPGAGAPPPAPSPSVAAPSGSGPTGGATPPTPTPTPTPPAGPPPGAEPLPRPSLPPLPGPISPLRPVVEDVVDTVLDLLEPEQPGPEQPGLLDPVVDPLEQVLDPIVQPLLEPIDPVLDVLLGGLR